MIKFTSLLILSSLLLSCGTNKSKHSEEFIKAQNELTETDLELQMSRQEKNTMKILSKILHPFQKH